jgi:hypothetical protein
MLNVFFFARLAQPSYGRLATKRQSIPAYVMTSSIITDFAISFRYTPRQFYTMD